MNYDFAILGGGAAGLSLALEIVRSPLKERSILIVDRDQKNTNDRTWCFWTDRTSPLDAIAYHIWPSLRFISDGLDRTWDLSPFRYQMVRGIDFYNHAHSELAKHNVTFLFGEAGWEDSQEAALVKVDDRFLDATWVFDSRMSPNDIVQEPRYNTLKQHFTGWSIETDEPVFDPNTVTMFDLRTPQLGGITFFYILPFSETRALVEYTLFSAELLPEAAYTEALKGYLSNKLGVNNFRVAATEQGIIPMTDRPFKRRLGRHILSIGTPAGRVKPSTGYAFARIQRDSQRIVCSLIERGHPFSIPPDRPRSRFFDKVILEVLAREPQAGRQIFTDIFSRNPAVRVLKFLDDRSTWGDDLRILASPNPVPFLRSLIRLAGKVRYNFVSR